MARVIRLLFYHNIFNISIHEIILKEFTIKRNIKNKINDVFESMFCMIIYCQSKRRQSINIHNNFVRKLLFVKETLINVYYNLKRLQI